MKEIELKIPNLGEAEDTEVIEISVKKGEKLSKNDPIIVLESEKAAMEVPSDFDGKIKDIKVIFTEPDNIRLIIVKILTDQDGLYGVGCATFTQRPNPVKYAIEDYLKPFLIGKEVSNIEDIENLK